MSEVLDEHRKYLADPARLSGFQRAIGDVVRPGDVVLDLGAGTGILGFLACRAGAARVYAIEATGLIGLARELCRANGFGDRVTFIKAYSRWTDLPEKVDVVFADQIGRFGYEAGVFEYFSDARRRFLKPGGITVPSRIDLVVGAVESAAAWAEVDFWDSAPADLDFRACRVLARNTDYPVRTAPEELLGEPQVLAALDPSADDDIPIAGRVEITATRAGTLHGLAGWFTAQLSPTVELSNSPLSPHRVNRSNLYFPIQEPVDVAPGDRIEVEMQIALPRRAILTAEELVRWTVSVRAVDGDLKASSSHSTLEGMILCKEDLVRTSPAFAPRLTHRGQARVTVLSLLDGERRLAEVEAETLRRHPELFRHPDDAGSFVAEVVAKYAH